MGRRRHLIPPPLRDIPKLGEGDILELGEIHIARRPAQKKPAAVHTAKVIPLGGHEGSQAYSMSDQGTDGKRHFVCRGVHE